MKGVTRVSEKNGQCKKENSYTSVSVFTLVKRRIPWLVLLMLTSVFTAGIISSFEEKLRIIPVLTAYIPMLMGTGGNAGGQAAVTVIRGRATGEIEGRDVYAVLAKELMTAFLCALILSTFNFLRMYFLDRMLFGNREVTLAVILAVCSALFLTVVFAKLIGCLLPFAAAGLGFDPAVIVSPFIATLVDVFALVSYFRMALLFIDGLK